jgi:hypothetical protein
VGDGSVREPLLNPPKKLENVEIKPVIGLMKASNKLVIPVDAPTRPAPTSCPDAPMLVAYACLRKTKPSAKIKIVVANDDIFPITI